MRGTEKGILRLTWALGTALLLCSCAAKNATEAFLRPKVDLTYIKSVAVLPFENHGREEPPAVLSRELTITQILASGWFDVVDRRQVDSVLRDEAIAAGSSIDNNTLKRLGQRLGVQAFIIGSLDYAGEGRAGNSVYPELSLSLKLVDSAAGLVLWQASGRGSGYSLGDRLFGIAPKDSFQVTLGLVRSLLKTMGQAPRKGE